ncbi:MAG: hypothetical protein HDT28_00850 [Clostridiales bacterium]|nr:hypothetical protein [Clostridiales bacterium]
MNKTLKKSLIITGIVLGSIVGLFLVLYAILAIIGAAAYGEARKVRQYVCDVAGISEGIAPQGLTYAADKDVYIQTGYYGKGMAMLYLVNGKDSRRVMLNDVDGEPLKSHAGGVTCTKDMVYIANGSTLIAYSLNALYNANATTAVTALERIPVDNNAAFCYSDDEYLFVGEFYRAGNYETEKSHYYTTPNGDENKAIISCYKLNADGTLFKDGDQPYPLYSISVTGLVQGCAVKDGILVLSRSYGLKHSKLEYHKPVESADTMTVSFKKNASAESKTVPLYYADSTTMIKSLTLPAFSEDITIVNDRIVVTNEASANKYFVGKLFGSHKVYSYPMYTE